MTSPPPLLDTLHNVVSWYLIQDGLMCKVDAGRALETVFYDWSLIAKVHPDLPASLAAGYRYRHCNRARTKSLVVASPAGKSLRLEGPTQYLLAQVLHFTQPYALQDLHGTSLYAVRTWIGDVDTIAHTVSLHGLFYTLTHTTAPAANSYSVPYVDAAAATTVLVSQSWLHTQYPGWDDRLTTAQALGLSGEATMDYVCTPPVSQHAVPVLPADLTGVTAS